MRAPIQYRQASRLEQMLHAPRISPVINDWHIAERSNEKTGEKEKAENDEQWNSLFPQVSADLLTLDHIPPRKKLSAVSYQLSAFSSLLGIVADDMNASFGCAQEGLE